MIGLINLVMILSAKKNPAKPLMKVSLCPFALNASLYELLYNLINDPQWYAAQESDTTMLPIAVFLPGQ